MAPVEADETTCLWPRRSPLRLPHFGAMERRFYVQKIWPDGTPVGEPKPLYDGEQYTPPAVTAEGIGAVAAALGTPIEPVTARPSGAPPQATIARAAGQRKGRRDVT